ncbi:MAG: hypothetical protein AVDCRST_MAG11-2003, partial [uncultured Gemmatimonadaceae bacterium]
GEQAREQRQRRAHRAAAAAAARHAHERAEGPRPVGDRRRVDDRRPGVVPAHAVRGGRRADRGGADEGRSLEEDRRAPRAHGSGDRPL